MAAIFRIGLYSWHIPFILFLSRTFHASQALTFHSTRLTIQVFQFQSISNLHKKMLAANITTIYWRIERTKKYELMIFKNCGLKKVVHSRLRTGYIHF